jgi:hypothetical protein
MPRKNNQEISPGNGLAEAELRLLNDNKEEKGEEDGPEP